jgi:predicted amidohydrolase YtcJ
MLILYNAKIYTLDEAQPNATALAIQSGRIIAVGSDFEVLSHYGRGALRREMGGAVIWPGLTDAHIHLQNYALGLAKVDCETATREECLRRVAERARVTPPGAWILGHGWNQNLWPEGFGTAADLDAVSAGHPVYLTAKSLHAAWANSAALAAAGVNEHTPDPPDGRLERHASGRPTGILFEGAVRLIEKVIPRPSVEEIAAAIEASQTSLWSMGVTAVHDFDRRDCFAALQQLRERGRLHLRVLKSIPLEDLPHAVELGLRSGLGDDLLRVGGVKIFADGALGPRTAAMLQPYEGEDSYTGMLMLDAEEILAHGRAAVETGLSLAIHAIGDRANHEVLEAFAQLRAYERERNLPPLRHRIEHVQVIHPHDLGRLARLGIIASMQPLHATSDMVMAERHWGERAKLSYAWRSLLDQGTKMAFGSDAPVEVPNPFWGLHAAVTRRSRDGSPGEEGWMPEQRIRLDEALRAYTIGAAYAAGWEDRAGRLAPGYFADLLVLDRDPFLMPPAELYAAQPVATMVAGEWVWQRG